jgi:hypothetical protein
MALKKITGDGGAVALPTGFNASFESWDASFDFGVVDTTSFDDSGYTNAENTICKMTFNAAGTAVYDDTNGSPISGTALAATFAPLSTAGSITLTAQTGCTYTLTGLVTTVGHNRSAKQGTKHDLSYSGENQGAVTQTWDVTA